MNENQEFHHRKPCRYVQTVAGSYGCRMFSVIAPAHKSFALVHIENDSLFAVVA